MEHAELVEGWHAFQHLKRTGGLDVGINVFLLWAQNQQVFNPIVFNKCFTCARSPQSAFLNRNISVPREGTLVKPGWWLCLLLQYSSPFLAPPSLNLVTLPSTLRRFIPGIRLAWRCGQLLLCIYAWSQISLNVIMMYTVQGYTGKMYLDQGWLTQQTSDSVFWRLTATFQNEVKEFKGSRHSLIDAIC